MRVGAKEKNMKLYVKMIKFLTVANPAHGVGFLEEVSSHVYQIMPINYLGSDLPI
jgi:hypothetical protein